MDPMLLLLLYHINRLAISIHSVRPTCDRKKQGKYTQIHVYLVNLKIEYELSVHLKKYLIKNGENYLYTLVTAPSHVEEAHMNKIIAGPLIVRGL